MPVNATTGGWTDASMFEWAFTIVGVDLGPISVTVRRSYALGETERPRQGSRAAIWAAWFGYTADLAQLDLRWADSVPSVSSRASTAPQATRHASRRTGA